MAEPKNPFIKNEGELTPSKQVNVYNLGGTDNQRKLKVEKVNFEDIKDTWYLEEKTIDDGISTPDIETNSQALAKKMRKSRDFELLNNDIIEEKKYKFREFLFDGFNDYELFVRAWDNVENAKAVILLTHGMVEHGLRYDDFAKYLNKHGYIVIVPDIRGHGKTAGSPELVGIAQGDIFGDTVRDNIKLAENLKKAYNLPLIFIGHSYGSFIVQSLIQNYHKHICAILIGSASFKGTMSAKAGKMVANITAFFKGKNAKANMIAKMTFGNYGKGKEDGNWLSHDHQVYKDYKNDPYCGNVCTAQFYKSFFANLIKLNTKAGLGMIDKDKPLLITSGEADPVAGKKHKLLDVLYDTYVDIGVKDVTYKLWPNGYHEILNETFNYDVYRYIVDWLDKKTPQKKY